MLADELRGRACSPAYCLMATATAWPWAMRWRRGPATATMSPARWSPQPSRL